MAQDSRAEDKKEFEVDTADRPKQQASYEEKGKSYEASHRDSGRMELGNLADEQPL